MVKLLNLMVLTHILVVFDHAASDEGKKIEINSPLSYRGRHDKSPDIKIYINKCFWISLSNILSYFEN